MLKHGDFAYALSFVRWYVGYLSPKILTVKTTFGVSGTTKFNSNLILYDRSTESLWAQMLQSVNGPLMEQETFTQAIEATWAAWKAWYPKQSWIHPTDDQEA
jgi:hypothetical protein